MLRIYFLLCLLGAAQCCVVIAPEAIFMYIPCSYAIEGFTGTTTVTFTCNGFSQTLWTGTASGSMNLQIAPRRLYSGDCQISVTDGSCTAVTNTYLCTNDLDSGNVCQNYFGSEEMCRSASITPTPSVTRTRTATISITRTPSPTSTRTPTSSISQSRTASQTPTRTRTPTRTPSPTRTVTPSVTPSRSPASAPTDGVPYVYYAGLYWAWASPCSGGCSVLQFDGSGNVIGQRGNVVSTWKIPTCAQAANMPPATLWNNFASVACASPWFDPTFTHCDYSDGTSGYIVGCNYPSNYSWETFLVFSP